MVVPDGAVSWNKDQLGISPGVIEYRFVIYDELQLIDILGEHMDELGYSSYLHTALLQCQAFLEKGGGDSLGEGKGEKGGLIEMSNKVVASGKHKQTQFGAKMKNQETYEQQEIWGSVTRAKTQEIRHQRSKVKNPLEASCEKIEHSRLPPRRQPPAYSSSGSAQAYRVRASVNQNGSSSHDVNAESNKKQQHQKPEQSKRQSRRSREEVRIPYELPRSPSTDTTSDSVKDYGQTLASHKVMFPSHLGRRELVAQQEKIVEAKRRDGSPKRAVDAIEKNVVEKKASSGSGYPDPASHVLHPQHNGLPAYFAARRAPQDFWTSPAHPTQRTDTGKNHGLIYYGPSGGPRSSRINDCEGPGCFTKMSGVEEWNRHDNHYYCRRCYEDNNFLKTERKRAASSGSAAAASSSAQVAPRTDVIRGASSGSG